MGGHRIPRQHRSELSRQHGVASPPTHRCGHLHQALHPGLCLLENVDHPARNRLAAQLPQADQLIRWAIIYRRPSTGPHGLEGRQQARAPPRQKEPVFIATRSLSTSLDRQDPADQALWGEGSDFFFVLRRYEIVATTATTFWWFALKAADVTIIDAAGSPTLDPSHPEAVCIRLEGSEASQSEPPVVRMLSRSGHRSRARCLEHCFSCAPEETCRRRAQCCIHEQAWRTILCHCDPKCTGDPRHRTGMGDDPRLQHALV
ncbi:hypothetical protein PI126_g18263 [Phytophthora idaei]|nr:hypothetical protein PI126_g18263 [Phytophthora idaei]